MEFLDTWDRAWFMTLHELREGTSLPIRPLRRWFKYQGKAASRIQQVEGMNVVEYWTDFLSEEPTRPRSSDWEPPRFEHNKSRIERLQRDELEWLRHHSDQKLIQERSEGLKIWEALWRARTLPALAEACKQWISFHKLGDWSAGEDLIPGRSVAYPVRILDNAKQFLAMKRDSRFPRSAQADDGRLDYISRGMAGIHIGLSPLTAIERLRNLKHSPGGALWNERARRCSCWRCFLVKDQQDFYKQLGESS
jgi:hypothetical protein